MFDFGEVMLTHYNKDKSSMFHDFALNHLGYYTDNGAYYYYMTETNKTYEETIIDMKQYALSQNIPFRYLQLDSWWYYKGIGNGVKNWTVMPSIFPNGIEYVYEQTQWPIVGHNRYWASDTTYATQNGGTWNFIIEGVLALPTQREFWDYLMQSSKTWGLITYEQDWLYTQIMGMNATLADPNLSRNWLMQMGQAATDAGLTIQYCMPYPRHALQSLELSAVNQIRASDDYHPDNSQWHIGISSILAYALGLAPSKDNFWTTTVQPGNPYNLQEDYPELESAIATYSLGPVGPSDKIGYANRDLIMKSCTADGTLLQPSRPATTLDTVMIQRAFANHDLGELWATYTQLEDKYWHWDHIIAMNMNTDYHLLPQDLTDPQADTNVQRVAYTIGTDTNIDINNLVVVSFDANSPIPLKACQRADFQLWHTAPVFSNDMILFGELNKWVPVSAERFSQVSVTSKTLSMILSGSAQEIVTVTIGVMNQINTTTTSCTLPAGGTTRLSVFYSQDSLDYSC